jgi:type IV pilus assembly protein PilB
MQEGPQKGATGAAVSYNREELEEAVRKQAESQKIPYLDVRTVNLLPDVLAIVSVEEAKGGVLPISKNGNQLVLGTANPQSEQTVKTTEYLSKFFTVQLMLISWEAIKDALPNYAGLTKVSLEQDTGYEIQAITTAVTFKELAEKINTAPLQDILKYMVTMAIESKSSDIHLEPEKDGARLRFRIDGVLHVVGQISTERFQYVLSQIELSSGMKLNVDEAQEGRLEVKLKDENISIRVETMPTLYGDDISLRIFNTAATMLSLADLGINDYDKKILSTALARPQGMILVVGPTGAGKTSTIYATLNALNSTEVKIITLEDPIEYALPGITQSQIHEGESFDERLKAVLREDPDIVMVGEIRDGDTADVALHAALTGHVMISTFHANDTATALGLLKELSSEKMLLSTAINLVIAQRLVRKLCEKCKTAHTLTPFEKEYVDKIWSETPEEAKVGKELNFFEAPGCEACGGLGFTGRVGIFEMLQLNLDLQKLLSRDDLTVAEFKEQAKKSGLLTMEQDGILKATEGITALSEVMKAIKE